MLEVVFGVCSKRTERARGLHFSGGSVMSAWFWALEIGRSFSWRPLSSSMGQGLVFEGSLVLLESGGESSFSEHSGLLFC